MKKVYVVDLTDEEREELEELLSKGELRARKANRAHILLLADKKEGWTDKAIAKALHTSQSTVERTRRRFVEGGGLEPALNEAPRPGGQRRLTGEQEAYLLALASSDPPEGKKHWTMQLLADRMVELEVVGSPISDETVRRTLKKGMLSHGKGSSGASPR
jgi:transposase